MLSSVATLPAGRGERALVYRWGLPPRVPACKRPAPEASSNCCGRPQRSTHARLPSRRARRSRWHSACVRPGHRGPGRPPQVGKRCGAPQPPGGGLARLPTPGRVLGSFVRSAHGRVARGVWVMFSSAKSACERMRGASATGWALTPSLTTSGVWQWLRPVAAPVTAGAGALQRKGWLAPSSSICRTPPAPAPPCPAALPAAPFNARLAPRRRPPGLPPSRGRARARPRRRRRRRTWGWAPGARC